jgi:hypothetical protein
MKTRHTEPVIERDATWPKMFRIRLADGSLTDMVNRSRAKEVLANISSSSLSAAAATKRRPS